MIDELVWDYDPEIVEMVLGIPVSVRNNERQVEEEDLADQEYLYYHNGGMF
jgi:hypothetical protein